jgi:hypothetical protein
MFEKDPVVGGIGYTGKGEIIMADGIGLGARFDEGYLEGLEKIIV